MVEVQGEEQEEGEEDGEEQENTERLNLLKSEEVRRKTNHQIKWHNHQVKI